MDRGLSGSAAGKNLCWVLFWLAGLLPQLAVCQELAITSDELSASSALLNGTDGLHGRISIDVVVTDDKGSAVSGLRAGDFSVLDNGTEKSIVTFEPSDSKSEKADSPLSIVLVIDAIDLAPPAVAEAERAAQDFLRMNGGVLPCPVSVYRVTKSEIQALTNPSMSGNAIAQQLLDRKNMRTIRQMVPRPQLPKYVAVPDAPTATIPTTREPSLSLPEALKDLGVISIEQRRIPGRKLLYWIGPGWHANAVTDPRLFAAVTELSTRLREARIALSMATESKFDTKPGEPASLTGPREEQPAYKAIKSPNDIAPGSLGPEAIAARSGGRMLFAKDHLAEVMAADARLAATYYHLSFDPEIAAGIDEYHALTVKLGKSSLAARTIAGYYDEPVFYDQPHFGLNLISIADLEDKIGRGQNASDRGLADDLSGLELSERMITPRLTRLLTHMRGPRSRSELTALADRSVFLDPPAADVDTKAAPDGAGQKQILLRAAEFLKQEIPRLPNFYAVRSTVQYGEPEPPDGTTWKIASGDQRLQLERTTRARVLYRDGNEVADLQEVKKKSSLEQLVTSGTFGPILISTFQSAIAPGSVVRWRRWEKTSNGTAAVFSYTVSPGLAHFQVGFCCLAVDGANDEFKRHTSFHGEMAIDPETGRFLRLVVEADLEARLPLITSGIAVEYGPVLLGNQTYFCPTSSVSLSRQRRLWEISEWGTIFRVFGPFKTVLNDESFSNYHLFRSESRILPDFDPGPDKP